jgi:hypothetical protein
MSRITHSQPKIFSTVIWVVLSLFLLSACGSKSKKKEQAHSCVGYFKVKPRPSWVDTEGLKNGVYYSQGVAQCTGLKTIDVKEASTNARGNLSRMLETQVRSEILLIRKSNTATRSGSESGQASTTIASDALLKNSSIYAHWVDPNSGSVYSAVKVSKSSIDKAIQDAKDKEQAKFKNQIFTIQVEGEHQKQLALSITKVLGENGVSKIVTNQEQAQYALRAKIQSIDIFKAKKLVRVEVFVSIIDLANQSTKWSQQLNGKSISFQGFERDYQIRQALIDAFNRDQQKLQSALEKSIDE